MPASTREAVEVVAALSARIAAACCERPRLVEAVGHRERLAVIGDGDVLEPGVPRGPRHGLGVGAAVGGGRVHVQVAAEILPAESSRGSVRASAASISPRFSRSSGGTNARPSAS